MNKKRVLTLIMVVLLLFASLSLIIASFEPVGFGSASETHTSMYEYHGIPIAGNVTGQGPYGGG